MGELAKRRKQTEIRIAELRRRLKSAEKIAAGKASVYATGSFGRGEASPHSDLDLFIVGRRNGVPDSAGIEHSLLKNLDDIRVKAELIEVSRKMGFPEFSGDGQYLTHYSVHDFTKTLGTPEDDVTNTFTARLLLLLESQPLIEQSVYDDVIQEVIAAYWRDYADHKSNFMPAFLANDILRLWRTFCVNYEARTKRAPDQEKAKGKIKNYKLKHSRLLTCFSGLLYLLAIYRLSNAVSPSDALDMVKKTPTQRLQWIGRKSDFKAARLKVSSLVGQYEKFLATTNVPEDKLIEQFMDKKIANQHMQEAFMFGDMMFDVLKIVGANTKFYRLLVV